MPRRVAGRAGARIGRRRLDTRLADRGRDRRFARLLAATATSNTGDGVRDAAFPLLAATLTANPVAVSLVGVLTHLPWLAAPVAGALVDRFSLRRVMVVADVVRALLLLALGLVAATGALTLGALLVAVTLVAVFEVFFDTAAMALVPALVAGPDLERANGRLTAAEVVTQQFAGKPIGGVLTAAAPAAPILVDAVSFAGSAAFLAGLKGGDPPREQAAEPLTARAILSETRAGVAWALRNPSLRLVLMAAALLAGLQGAVMSTLVLFSLHELHTGMGAFGILLGVAATGSLAGAWIAPRLANAAGRRRALLVATLLAGASFGVMSQARSFALAAALLALNSLAAVIWNVVSRAMQQILVPEELLGRALATYRTAAWGAIPLGSLLGGVLASQAGLRAPMLVAGIGSALAGLLVLRLPPESERRRRGRRGRMRRPGSLRRG
jgi:MFS family permease